MSERGESERDVEEGRKKEERASSSFVGFGSLIPTKQTGELTRVFSFGHSRKR